MKTSKGSKVQTFQGADGPNPYAVMELVKAAREWADRLEQMAKGAEVPEAQKGLDTPAATRPTAMSVVRNGKRIEVRA